jgi:hypothetical protein
MRLVRTAYLALALVVLTVALLVAAAQAGSTNGPGAGRGESAPAQPVVVPDACKSTTWNVTITPFPGAYHMNPLIKCGKKLSGKAGLEGGCTATISGTLMKKVVNMTWSSDSPCDAEVTTFTGTLDIKKGTGSGTWTDPCCTPDHGPWTATRTS